MRTILIGLTGLLLASATPALADVKILSPLPASVVGNHHVAAVDVTVSPKAQKSFDGLEKKAREKRDAAIKAGPAKTSSNPNEARAAHYATLPFADMFSDVVMDETQAWGLSNGRPLRLSLQIDTLSMADDVLAFLIADTDEFVGHVTMSDARTGEPLGKFKVDIFELNIGAIDMAFRGAGVREKLAASFAKDVAKTLSGRKKKVAA